MSRNRTLGAPYEQFGVAVSFTTEPHVDLYLVSTPGSGPAVVVTLDPNAQDGDQVRILDASGNSAAFPITVVGTIVEGTDTLNVDGGCIEYTFSFGLGGWTAVVGDGVFGILGINIDNSGTLLAGGPFKTLNMENPNIVATNAGAGVANLTVTGGVAVENSGTALAGGPFTTFNFTNPNITATNSGGGVAAIAVPGGGGGDVTAVTGTAPIASSGGATPNISISPATDVDAGSMSAADKAKLDGYPATPPIILAGEQTAPSGISFADASPYTPQTTGTLRIEADISAGFVAQAGIQNISFQMRVGGAPVGPSLLTQAFIGQTVLAGHVVTNVPCTAGVPITIGAQQSGATTPAASAFVITIQEQQTSP